jgi:hypothetical protein
MESDIQLPKLVPPKRVELETTAAPSRFTLVIQNTTKQVGRINVR